DPLGDASGTPASASSVLKTSAEVLRMPPVGTIIDYVGGVTDLRARVLRAVGEPAKRLEEDHLRALRAVRLAAKLGFEVETGTRVAITAHASELAGVSRERIGEEVRRMLLHPERARAVAILNELALEGPEQVSGGRGNGASIGLCLAAWAVDRVGGWRMGVERELGEAVDRWRKALCLSNEERAEFGAIIEMLGVISGE